jgi:hypothetical protein
MMMVAAIAAKEGLRVEIMDMAGMAPTRGLFI